MSMRMLKVGRVNNLTMWKLFKILWGKERKIAAEGSDESMSLTGHKYLYKTQNISILTF